MKQVLHILSFILFYTVSSGQDTKMEIDTIILTDKTNSAYLEPTFVFDELYQYEVFDSSLSLKDGDTVYTTNKVSSFTIIPRKTDNDDILIQLILDEDYWKQIIYYDTSYSSWDYKSIPEVHLRYKQNSSEFEVIEREEIISYILKYAKEAELHFVKFLPEDQFKYDLLRRMETILEKPEVLKNWLTLTSGVSSILDYYSYLFPKVGNQVIELKVTSEFINRSTFFVTQVEKQGEFTIYTIREDIKEDMSSTDQMLFDILKPLMEMDSTYSKTEEDLEFFTDEYFEILVDSNNIVTAIKNSSYSKRRNKSTIYVSGGIYSIKLKKSK